MSTSLLICLAESLALDAAAVGELETRSPRELIGSLKASGADQERLSECLAHFLHLEFVSADTIAIQESARPLLPRMSSVIAKAAPLSVREGRLVVAVADPLDLDLQERLEFAFGMPVKLVVASEEAIEYVLETGSRGADQIHHATRDLSSRTIAEDVSEFGFPAASQVDENSAPLVKLVNTVLREAVAKQASDIHVEPQHDGTRIRYRLDGVLYPMAAPLDRRFHEPLVSRIKVMSELNIAEHRIPQDGRFSMAFSETEVDFRVSVLPGASGEAVVIRILDHRSIPGHVKNLSLKALGFHAQVAEGFGRCVAEPHGLVLVTGPTGSGKTTTLYAALNEFDRDHEKIITIEDPVEYQLPGVVQIAVNEKKQLTFSRGLRSILRHDPDRIMVGEIRDRETAEIAVQSALTGHLVLTTVHANNAFDVLDRMRHMGIDMAAFVQSLNCVLAQRLVRVLCNRCKSTKHDFNESQTSHAVGCEACGETGYRGRTAVGELIVATPRLRQMLIDGEAREIIENEARAGGYTSMHEAARMNLELGVTSLDEIRRVMGLRR